MNKFEEIRPIVLGLAIRDGKLLVGESFDKGTKVKIKIFTLGTNLS